MRGFSLIELLITMTIVGLLAALALPGYTRTVHRALRQDARLALLHIQHRQEMAFASNLTYAPQGSGSSPPAMPRRSEQGHYLLELLISADGMAYTALARADPAGRQASDAPCAMLSVDESGHRRSANAAGSWRDDDPDRCWG